MALFSLYATALPCISQTKTCMAGLEMISLSDNHFTAQLSYGFGHHWSLAAEASIPFNILIKPTSETEKEHQTEFIGTKMKTTGPAYHCERIYLSYWPSEAFNGISISAGIQASCLKDINCFTRIGYMFHVWQNIHINTSIQIPLEASSESTAVTCENIGISLEYKF